jgi:ribosomal protein S18 acetylase RimI-like enzyme
MSTIDFKVMTDLRHEAEVVQMMNALYAEDEPASPVNRARFPQTVQRLIMEPLRGNIVLIFQSQGHRQKLCGYGLLIPYWSNEFGGTLLFIDELFVAAHSRGQGLAKAVFQHLGEVKPFDAVAFALEVSPANLRARRLYESLGFKRRTNL